MIQIPQFVNSIFALRNIDQDCDIINSLMQPIANNIHELLDVGCQEQAATLFIQLTAATAQHFISEEHWCYFDDMYSPDYTLTRVAEWFGGLIQKGKLRDSAQHILSEGLDEIKRMQSFTDYGYPSFLSEY